MDSERRRATLRRGRRRSAFRMQWRQTTSRTTPQVWAHVRKVAFALATTAQQLPYPGVEQACMLFLVEPWQAII